MLYAHHVKKLFKRDIDKLEVIWRQASTMRKGLENWHLKKEGQNKKHAAQARNID